MDFHPLEGKTLLATAIIPYTCATKNFISSKLLDEILLIHRPFIKSNKRKRKFMLCQVPWQGPISPVVFSTRNLSSNVLVKGKQS